MVGLGTSWLCAFSLDLVCWRVASTMHLTRQQVRPHHVTPDPPLPIYFSKHFHLLLLCSFSTHCDYLHIIMCVYNHDYLYIILCVSQMFIGGGKDSGFGFLVKIKTNYCTVVPRRKPDTTHRCAHTYACTHICYVLVSTYKSYFI